MHHNGAAGRGLGGSLGNAPIWCSGSRPLWQRGTRTRAAKVQVRRDKRIIKSGRASIISQYAIQF